MKIHLLHGAVSEWVKGAYSFRNYVSIAKLEAYLRAREAPYVDWGYDGDCLTVDDATAGGAEACRIARHLGHAVVFFVNPLQVESGQPYFFSMVDAAIDARQTNDIAYHGKHFDLEDPHGRRLFRLAVKSALMVLPPEAALDRATEVAGLLGAQPTHLPEHSRPITTHELRCLHDIGVRIENHGWSHIDIRSLDESAFCEHVHRGRDWIAASLGKRSDLYAVPFGLSNVPTSWRRYLTGDHFLADANRPSGSLGVGAYNRDDLTSRLQST